MPVAAIDLLRTSSMEELTAELPMLALTFTRKARPAHHLCYSPTICRAKNL